MPTTARSSLRLGLLVVMAVTGVAVGYFLPDRQTESSTATVRDDSPAVKSTAVTRHAFDLTAEDLRDPVPAPTIAVDRHGRVFVAWASNTETGERTLFLTSSTDRGAHFAAPRGVARSAIFTTTMQARGKTITRTVRMTPHLVAHETLALAWTETRADRSGVRMVVATSHDGGETLSEPVCLHEHADARPTFTALSGDERGGLAASWLDHRHHLQQVFATAQRVAQEQNAFAPEACAGAGEEGRGVCPCCPTATLLVDGAQYVAFRNLADGFRDIWIARRDAGATEFAEPVPVVPPTWKFDGCPHDGPSLALTGDTLHVTWMDARTGRQRVYYASGRCSHLAPRDEPRAIDAGLRQAHLAERDDYVTGSRHDLKFTSRELHPAGTGEQGNARLCADARGRLHAVWEESLDAPSESAGNGAGRHAAHEDRPTGSGRVVVYAVAEPGSAFSEPRPVDPQPGRFQTRPALTCDSDGRVFVTFNEVDEQGKRIVVVRLAEEPRRGG